MRPLHELLEVQEPAMAFVERWAREAELPVEILPPSTSNGEILVELQVTTRSVLGAIAYGTGGILIDRGG